MNHFDALWDRIRRDAAASPIDRVVESECADGKPWKVDELTGGMRVKHGTDANAFAYWLFSLQEGHCLCEWQLCSPGKAKTVKGVHNSGKLILQGSVRFSNPILEDSTLYTLFGNVKMVTSHLKDFRIIWHGPNGDPGWIRRDWKHDNYI